MYNLFREKSSQAAAAFGRFSFSSFFSPLHRAEVVGKLIFGVGQFCRRFFFFRYLPQLV